MHNRNKFCVHEYLRKRVESESGMEIKFGRKSHKFAQKENEQT